jgi:hypothetical protein
MKSKMRKQLLLSCLGGVVLTVGVIATPAVYAACDGYCADRKITNGQTEYFAGCTMYYDANSQLQNVECAYTSVRVVPLME